MSQVLTLYTYSTDNVGDEIQTLAAQAVIDKLGYTGQFHYLNRDYPEYTCPEAPCFLIANGWYMHREIAFPAHVTPLFISVHTTPLWIKKTKAWKEYFKRFEPIGC